MDIGKFFLLPPRQTARQREVLRHLTEAERTALRALGQEYGRKRAVVVMPLILVLTITLVDCTFSPLIKAAIVLGVVIVGSLFSNKFLSKSEQSYRKGVILLLRNSAYARERGIDLS